MIYRVSGRSAATAATSNHCAAQLWNPSTVAPIWVRELHCVVTTAGAANLGVERSTARGATPTTTVTPDIDNDIENALAPPSATVLELATFTTQPTLATPALQFWYLPAVAGAGVMLVFGERGRGAIKVKPGNGLCLYTTQAVIFPASDITYVWEE
jgi:hypothetical protein